MSEIQGTLELEIEPTISMQEGTQLVFQCSWCGCVVVQPDAQRWGALGDCPSCKSQAPTKGQQWWQQHLPVSGLRLVVRGEA